MGNTKPEPIVVTVGRPSMSPDLKITAQPIEPVDRVWGKYIVTYEYRAKGGGTAVSSLRLDDFPRADGTNCLAAALLSMWVHSSNGPASVDPVFPDQGPLSPTDEERTQRRPRFSEWPVPETFTVAIATDAVEGGGA